MGWAVVGRGFGGFLLWSLECENPVDCPESLGLPRAPRVAQSPSDCQSHWVLREAAARDLSALSVLPLPWQRELAPHKQHTDVGTAFPKQTRAGLSFCARSLSGAHSLAAGAAVSPPTHISCLVRCCRPLITFLASWALTSSPLSFLSCGAQN